jgi:lipid-binding SYLF domain-containing protein
MKIRTRHVSLAICIGALFGLAAAHAAEDLKKEADQAITAFKNADSSLNTFFQSSAGTAVFPSVGKGGLIVGAAHGKGVVYEKGQAIGQATMTQASIGAQAGGQTFAEVIFFETPTALEDFKEGKFEMSAEVSAVVAAEGASKAAKYKNGVAVFTLPKKGAMVQASIGGQKFKYEPGALAPTGRPPKEEK